MVKEKYNDNLVNKLLVVFNEVAVDGKEEHVLQKLKSWITDTHMNVRAMGKAWKTVENHSNFLLFTNKQNPIEIPQEDRRYSVFKTSSKGLVDIVDVPTLIKHLKEERKAFIDSLCQLDNSLFKIIDKTMDTEAKEVVSVLTQAYNHDLKTAFIEKDVDAINDLLQESLDSPLNDKDSKDRRALLYGTNPIDIMARVEMELEDGYISNPSLLLLDALCYGSKSQSYVGKMYADIGIKKVRKIKGKSVRVTVITNAI
jgi:hypothetical protein